jgi:hypothetical protein
LPFFSKKKAFTSKPSPSDSPTPQGSKHRLAEQAGDTRGGRIGNGLQQRGSPAASLTGA